MTDFLTLDGLHIAYTSAGSPSNPPVILVHGLMSHRGVWSRTLDALQDRFYCIAFDLPGFGESDKPQHGDYSITTQAQRVLKVADHFGFAHFILFGHSMGGQIATYFASSVAPERVQKLISVDGAVTGKLSNRAQSLNRMLVVIGARLPSLYKVFRVLFNSSKSFACWGFRAWFYQPESIPFESWKHDRDMAVNHEIAESALTAWNSLNSTNLTECLGEIRAQTLVLFGKQDGTIPIDQAYLFQKKLPSAQLTLIENCGHFPMYETFDEYITAIDGFLNKP